MAFTDKETRREQTQIARKKLTLTSIVSESEASTTIQINGELLNYVIDAPNLTTDAAFDFVVSNSDGKTIYTNTTISDNSDTLVLLSAAPIPLSGMVTFKVDFTTNQVAEFLIYLYYR